MCQYLSLKYIVPKEKYENKPEILDDLPIMHLLSLNLTIETMVDYNV